MLEACKHHHLAPAAAATDRGSLAANARRHQQAGCASGGGGGGRVRRRQRSAVPIHISVPCWWLRLSRRPDSHRQARVASWASRLPAPALHPPAWRCGGEAPGTLRKSSSAASSQQPQQSPETCPTSCWAAGMEQQSSPSASPRPSAVAPPPAQRRQPVPAAARAGGGGSGPRAAAAAAAQGGLTRLEYQTALYMLNSEHPASAPRQRLAGARVWRPVNATRSRACSAGVAPRALRQHHPGMRPAPPACRPALPPRPPLAVALLPAWPAVLAKYKEADWFRAPVNWELLGIPDYPEVRRPEPAAAAAAAETAATLHGRAASGSAQC